MRTKTSLELRPAREIKASSPVATQAVAVTVFAVRKGLLINDEVTSEHNLL